MVINKKGKNIIFIILILSLLIYIVRFNYNNSIYNFNHKDKIFNIFNIDKPNIPIYIDNSLYLTNENIFIGGSELHTLFNKNENQPLLNTITNSVASYQVFYEILKYYLELHPETKKAYFFICYPSFFNVEREDFIIEKERQNLLLKKIKLLLSTNGLKVIINNKKWEANNQNGRRYYPFNSDFCFATDAHYDENTEKNLMYASKIVELLKEKNIDVEFIIPPYNAVYLALLYSNSDNYKLIEKIKRFFIDNYGIVYDFSVINKYSGQNLLDDTAYMFHDPNHGNDFYGSKLIRTMLFDRKYGAGYLYIKHTKDNIEANLLKQRKDIEKYIKENKKYYNFYLSVAQKKGEIKNPGSYYKFFKYDSIPEEIWDDHRYIQDKIKELKNTDE